MIDRDIQRLDELPSKRSLDGLEADIWVGVEARINARKASRLVFSCQAAIVAIALLSGIAAETRTAMAEPLRTGLDAFSIRADLTPSSRLLGR